jgi:hypothetical protein
MFGRLKQYEIHISLTHGVSLLSLLQIAVWGAVNLSHCHSDTFFRTGFIKKRLEMCLDYNFQNI